MNHARDEILNAIRRHSVPDVAYPEQDVVGIRYEDPRAAFTEILTAVGGDVHSVPDLAAVGQSLCDLDAFTQAQQRASQLVELSGDWNVRLDDVQDPHQLADLDFALFRGEFGVAENGAIWVTDHGVRQRAAFFISQHLALVIPTQQIVHNMHEAYARLAFNDNTFGCFISGPSKTADIEQSLVIGAHGARSLTVFLVDEF